MRGLSWCVCLGGVSMPSKPPRPCMVQGCRGFSTGNGYCKEHQYIPKDKQSAREKGTADRRGTAAERGYDGQWQKVRWLKLRTNPLCEECEKRGRVVPAKEVHHIQPIKERPDLRLSVENLQSLCVPCHDKTKHGSHKG